MTALQPVDQQTILFYDDEITAVVVNEDGRQVVYVPIRPICSFLGLNWSGQRQRIQRDPILDDVAGECVIHSPQGGSQGMLCLPLDYLNGWLFGINTNRIKSELRESVLRYQRDCYRVLAEAFLHRPAAAESLTPLEQVREMGRAIMQMAEEQIAHERRIAKNEQRLSRAAQVVGEHGQRLTAIETRLFSAEVNAINDEQASQIKEAVKLVAHTLSKRSGRNEFGGVYGTLYTEFGITSYKLLPVEKFSDAMAFLTDWYKRL